MTQTVSVLDEAFILPHSQPVAGVHDEFSNAKCEMCGLPGDAYGSGVYNHHPYRILSCPGCTLIWTDPLIDQPSTSNGESDEYWAEDVYLANVEAQKKRFRQQVRAFLKASGRTQTQELKVLEVGSGLGFFLDVCEEFGISAAGCDIDAEAVRYANRERPRVRLGTLDSFYDDNTFDAVFAFNLIEHLPHPKSFLEEAHRVLRPGGTLVLETPLRESLFHRVARLGSLVTRGRLNLYGLHPGGHIYKFSKKSFQFSATGLSFQKLSACNINSPFNEIWGKSSIAAVDHRLLYRTALPFLWGLAKLTRTGNRIFIMLRKSVHSASQNEIQKAAPC